MAKANLETWLELCRRLSVADASARPAFCALGNAYATPPRAYHTLDHISHCLTEFTAVRSLVHEPEAVEAALWFHDVVYDPRRNDNEDRSAAFANELLTGLSVSASCCAAVQRLIRVTRHDGDPSSPDETLVLDCDLAVLGQSPEVFLAYDANIRAEYAWVPEPLYREKRAAILAAFLSRPRIYHTPVLHSKYEATARRNLTALISRLRDPR